MEEVQDKLGLAAMLADLPKIKAVKHGFGNVDAAYDITN